MEDTQAEGGGGGRRERVGGEGQVAASTHQSIVACHDDEAEDDLGHDVKHGVGAHLERHREGCEPLREEPHHLIAQHLSSSQGSVTSGEGQADAHRDQYTQ